MNKLLNKFKKQFKTEFIYPEIFHKINILGIFSKKIPYSFNFSSLNYDNSFKFFFPKQIHSTDIIEITDSKFSKIPLPFSIKCDGVFTDKKNLFLGVRTADCVPILLATIDRKYIGIIHAGWRGSVNKILEKALKKLFKLNYQPSEILIAIGPHIKVCCYEIGDEVIEKLKNNFTNFEEFLVFKNSKNYLDLEKLNLYQAINLGIPQKNIWISKDCTYCLNAEYWSHRYHGEKRSFQISLIGIIEQCG